MQIKLNIKPTKIIGKSKYQCLDTLMNGGWFGELHNGWNNYTEGYAILSPKAYDFVIVYTCQKYRRKIVNGEYVPTHWEMYAYKIPVELLKMAGLKVKQESRSFKLVKV